MDILKAINAAVLTVILGLNASALAADRGTKFQPLQVVLIPADGGTEDGTRADFLPVFNAVSRSTGLTFELRVGQSYNAVVEAMCSGSADIAFFGPVSYVQARQRGCAELLAVAVENGKSIYYAGIFTRADSGLASMEDLKGKSVAFGDINSASAFVFPMAMILDAKLDPIRDLRAIRLTGSHANSLAALTQRQVDAASLSFESFEKAINQGAASSRDIKVLARSVAIPNPPLGMNTKLSIDMKKKLKAGFGSIAQAPGVTPDMIRGYGGKRVEGYDSTFDEAQFDLPARMMVSVDDGLKGEVLKKAAQP